MPKKPTVHSDTWFATHGRFFFFFWGGGFFIDLFCFRCYYQHTARDSLSTICGTRKESSAITLFLRETSLGDLLHRNHFHFHVMDCRTGSSNDRKSTRHRRITCTFMYLSADLMKLRPGQENCGLHKIQRSSKWHVLEGLKTLDITRSYGV